MLITLGCIIPLLVVPLRILAYIQPYLRNILSGGISIQVGGVRGEVFMAQLVFPLIISALKKNYKNNLISANSQAKQTHFIKLQSFVWRAAEAVEKRAKQANEEITGKCLFNLCFVKKKIT